MSVFNIAKVEGVFENSGQIETKVLNVDDDDFCVALCHYAGPCSFQFHMTPDQSRRLRAALEDAEAKAEILTAAI
jgi:hypothetical protein